MNDFYCVACGNYRKLEEKVTRKGKKPICIMCNKTAKARRVKNAR